MKRLRRLGARIKHQTARLALAGWEDGVRTQVKRQAIAQRAGRVIRSAGLNRAWQTWRVWHTSEQAVRAAAWRHESIVARRVLERVAGMERRVLIIWRDEFAGRKRRQRQIVERLCASRQSHSVAAIFRRWAAAAAYTQTRHCNLQGWVVRHNSVRLGNCQSSAEPFLDEGQNPERPPAAPHHRWTRARFGLWRTLTRHHNELRLEVVSPLNTFEAALPSLMCLLCCPSFLKSWVADGAPRKPPRPEPDRLGNAPVDAPHLRGCKLPAAAAREPSCGRGSAPGGQP